MGARKTSTVLPKLQPNTQYSVSVAAVYPSGLSRDITGDGQTSKGSSLADRRQMSWWRLTDVLNPPPPPQSPWAESRACRC